MPLEVNFISLATGYKFKHENQSIYLSKDLCEFTPRRQWPNIPLPVPVSIPPQPAPVGPNTQLIRAMQVTHNMAADILHSQGTDPCAVYREKQVEYILNHVESGHKKCKVCNKELSSTWKLNSHIRATHCHSAAYKCSTCSKPFGDPYALSVHKRVHTASARKHICVYCGNAYLSKSKLTDHSDHVIRCSVCSPYHGVRFNHVKLFVCGCIIVGAQRLLGWFHAALVWSSVSFGHMFIIVFILCTLLYHVSPVYNLAILRSAH